MKNELSIEVINVICFFFFSCSWFKILTTAFFISQHEWMYSVLGDRNTIDLAQAKIVLIQQFLQSVLKDMA